AELLDSRIARGDGERTAVLAPGHRGSYRELQTAVDQIARVLVEDLELVPANRVLLRSPNTPLLAAAWLAVVKAGGVAVATMPMLRRRELAYIADKAKNRLALCDEKLAEECEAALAPVPATSEGERRAGARVVH